MGSLGANVRNSKKLYEQQNSFAGGMNTTEENVNLSDTESRNIENFLLTERGTLQKRLGSIVEYDVGRTLKERYNWMIDKYTYLNTPNDAPTQYGLGIFSAGYEQEYASFLKSNNVLGHFTKETKGQTEHYLALKTGLYNTNGDKIPFYNYDYANKVYQAIPTPDVPFDTQNHLKWDWIIRVSEEGYYCYNNIPTLDNGKITWELERDTDGTPKKYFIGPLGKLTEGDGVDPDNEAWWPVVAGSNGVTDQIVVRPMPRHGKWFANVNGVLTDPQDTRDLEHLVWKQIVFANPKNSSDISEEQDAAHTVITLYEWHQENPDRFRVNPTWILATYDENKNVTSVTNVENPDPYEPSFWEIIQNTQGSTNIQNIDLTNWENLTDEEQIARLNAAPYKSYFTIGGNVYRDAYNNILMRIVDIVNPVPFPFAQNIVFEDLWFNNQWGLSLQLPKTTTFITKNEVDDNDWELNAIQQGETIYLITNGKKYKMDNTASGFFEVLPYKPTFSEYNNLKGNLLGPLNTTRVTSLIGNTPGSEYDIFYNWDWTKNPNEYGQEEKKLPMLLGLMAQGIPQTGRLMNFKAVQSTPDTMIDDGSGQQVRQYTWKFGWQYVMDVGDINNKNSVMQLTNIPSASEYLSSFPVPGVDTGVIRLIGNLEGSGRPLTFHGLKYNKENSHYIGLRTTKSTPYNIAGAFLTYGGGYLGVQNDIVHDYFEYYGNDMQPNLDGNNAITLNFKNAGITHSNIVETGSNIYSPGKGSGPTGFMWDLAFEFDPKDVQQMTYAAQYDAAGKQTAVKKLNFSFDPSKLKIHLDYNEYGASNTPYYALGAVSYLSFEKNDLKNGESAAEDNPRGIIAATTKNHDIITGTDITAGGIRYAKYKAGHAWRTFDGDYTQGPTPLNQFSHLGLTSENNNFSGEQDIIPEELRFSLRHHSDPLMGVTGNNWDHIKQNWFMNGAVQNIIKKWLVSPIPGNSTTGSYHPFFFDVQKGTNKTDLNGLIQRMSDAMANIDYGPEISEMVHFLSGQNSPVSNSDSGKQSPVPHPMNMTEAFSAYASDGTTAATPIKLMLHFVLVLQILPHKTGGGSHIDTDYNMDSSGDISWYGVNEVHGNYDNERFDNSVENGTEISFASEGLMSDNATPAFFMTKTNFMDTEPPGGTSTTIINFPIAPINNVESYLPKTSYLSAINKVNNSYIYKDQYFMWHNKRPILFYSDIRNYEYFPLIQTVVLEDYPDEQIQVFQPFANSALIFTKYHIYRLDGSSIEDFSTSLVNSSVGTLNSKTVQAIRNSIYFVCDKGAYELTRSYSSDNQLLVRPIDTMITSLYDPKTDEILTTSDGKKFYIHVMNKKISLIYDTDSKVWTKWSYNENIQMCWVKSIKNSIYYITDDWKICRFNDTSDYYSAQKIVDNNYDAYAKQGTIVSNDILRYQMLYIDKFDNDVLFNDENELNIYSGKYSDSSDGKVYLINEEIKDCVQWDSDFTLENQLKRTTPLALGWNLENLVKYGYGYPVVAIWESKEWNGYANQTHNQKKWKETQIKFTRDSYATGGWYELKVDNNIVINPTYYSIELDEEDNELKIKVKNIDYLANPTSKAVLTRNAGMILSRSAILSSGDFHFTETDEHGNTVDKSFNEDGTTTNITIPDEYKDNWNYAPAKGDETIFYKPPYLASVLQDTSEKNLRKKRGKKGYSSQTIIYNDEPASFGIKSVMLVYKLKKAK